MNKKTSKMAKIKWKKVPESLAAMFDEVLPDDPRVERRKMFGCPCAFANGNMFTGLHQSDMILRLPENERSAFLKKFGTTIFEPMPGRQMKEYVLVPGELLEDRDELDEWMKKSLDYVASLPPKVSKRKVKTR